MRENNLPTLSYIESSDLSPGEILLEYVEGSINLMAAWTTDNACRWGKLSRGVHNIRYDDCFRYSSGGEKVLVNWGNFLREKHERSIIKAKENDNYRFKKQQLEMIDYSVRELFDDQPVEYCLIHGDLHTGNVLIRGRDLVLFDRESLVFSGDKRYDLAIAWLEMPGGSLVKTEDPDHTDGLEYLEAFISGYGWDFRHDQLIKKYIVLIAFSRLYTPFAKFYREIILNVIEA